jgi:hypothetical protein
MGLPRAALRERELADLAGLAEWWSRFADAGPTRARRCSSRARAEAQAPLARARTPAITEGGPPGEGGPPAESGDSPGQ